MPILLECSSCGKHFTAVNREAIAGARCPNCGTNLTAIPSNQQSLRGEERRQSDVGTPPPALSTNALDLVVPRTSDLARKLAEALYNQNLIYATANVLSGFDGTESLRGRLVQSKFTINGLSQFVLTALISDSLRAIVKAILADNRADSEELEIAYYLACPLAKFLGSTLEEYAVYGDLSYERLADFLNSFSASESVFGGNCKGSEYCGLKLCTAISYLSEDSSLLQQYEKIIITIMTEIMKVKGLLCEEERQVLKQELELINYSKRIAGDYGGDTRCVTN